MKTHDSTDYAGEFSLKRSIFTKYDIILINNTLFTFE